VRRIPLSRRSHVTGFQPIGKMAVEHESALERDFVTLTRFIDADAECTSQPVTIHFEDAGAKRRYTPDFLVRWGDGRRELVEVKYRADLKAQWTQLRPGFAEAGAWARENGAKFRIATERGIRGPRLANATRLLPLRTGSLDGAAAEAVLQATRRLATPTFGRLIEALPLERAVALSTAWRMIAQGLLGADLTAVVRFDTRVWAP
jgi:hypothetical protein